MIKILTSILLLSSLGILASRPSCQCRPASEEDIPHGANERITYTERTVREIHGTIIYRTGEPVKDVVVEVFDANGADNNLEQQKRRVACVTGEDGKFCFADLPSGKYVLWAGTRELDGMNDIHMRVNVDRRWWRSWFRSNKGIELELMPGT
jgi:hypothetical protein